MYVSTKSYDTRNGFSIAYRQWRADSHCQFIHGYALGFEFEFESETVDVRNWVVDFGSLKTLKDFLEDYFDHTLLVAQDDPELEFLKELDRRGIAEIREVERTGCEGLAYFLFEYVNEIWLPENGYTNSDVFCRKVRVIETEANSGWVEFTKQGWTKHLAKKDIFNEEDTSNGDDMISEGGCL